MRCGSILVLEFIGWIHKYMYRQYRAYFITTGLATLFALMIWFADGAFDYLFFYSKENYYLSLQPHNLLDVIFLRVYPYDLLMRMIYVVVSISVGFFLGRYLTRLNKSNRALLSSENRFRLFYTVEPNALLLVSQSSGDILDANPSALSLYGYTHQEIVGMEYSRLWQHSQEAYDLVRQCRNGGIGRHALTYHRKKDSTLFPVEASAGMFPLEKELVVQFVFHDLTRAMEHELQIKQQLEKLAALHTIDKAITANTSLTQTLDVLLEQIIQHLKIDASDILLLEPLTLMLKYAAGKGFFYDGLAETALRIGQGFAGKVAMERRMLYISNLTDIWGHPGKSQSIGQESFVTYIGIPLIAKGQVTGVLELYHRSVLNPPPDWFNFLETVAEQAAIAIDDAALLTKLSLTNEELVSAYDQTLAGWAHALELRDYETKGHSERVVDLAVKLGRSMGLDEQELVQLRCGALLHDIGKMAVPDHILNKPGPLSEEEWVIMRKHPEFARQMLEPIQYLRNTMDIPYSHHERWDGSGYPRGLRGEDIPLAARIFAVVDVWDALGSDRPYRSAWNPKRVVEYLQEQGGREFDPRVVNSFLIQK
jgi:PAS domain S-box-containing protein/putative nucleotidyltransferase with HDIG domain